MERTSPRRRHPRAPRSAPQGGVSRRAFLLSIMGIGGAILAGSALARRNRPVSSSPPAVDLADPASWWATRTRTGRLTFANWPYYIDRGGGGRPSLDLFERTTDTRVEYLRPIRDNAAFVGRIEPVLEAGQPTGYDLIVITNGPELTRLIEGDLLTPLDHDLLPNFAKSASPLVTGPSWDPKNRVTIAWQSGLTGIAYLPQAVDALGGPPRSVQDLFDQRLRGRVGMLRDLMDLGSFGVLSIGGVPGESTRADWRAAAARLVEQRESGVVRGYYDQGYVGALRRGDVWVSQAWSGDVFQLQLEGVPVRFAVPREGAVLWTDNLAIPRYAEHPRDAIDYMNYVYRPRIAAMIADWVQYISPVPAAERIIRERFGDPFVASSPLVFPDAQDRRRFHTYPVLAGADLDAWNAAFVPVPG